VVAAVVVVFAQAQPTHNDWVLNAKELGHAGVEHHDFRRRRRLDVGAGRVTTK
jgi:hypothetical protein